MDIMDLLSFEILFPLVLIGLLVIIFISGFFRKYPKRELMSLDDFMKDWLISHGQAHKLEKQFELMKKEPTGIIYMPLTYKGAKFFIKCGLSPNKVSIITLILSFLVFYGVLIASRGHALNLFTQQPYYGSWFIVLAFLVLLTGIIDGVDGAIARLMDIKSKSGAWLDNIIDRISDILLLVGLVPTNLFILSEYGLTLDFTWMVWTNIFLIFIYEYMRTRHEGLGLHEIKPFIGERPMRILVMFAFFLIYGISSFFVLLTNTINPAATKMWTFSHTGTMKWNMLIFQIVLLLIMTYSTIQLAKYSFRQLKKMDTKNT
jgi:phosphatidylglycerophosphate synthase